MSPHFKDIASLPVLPIPWDGGRRKAVVTFTPSPSVRGTASIIRYGRADLPHGENGSHSDILTFRFLPQTTPFEKWLITRELAIARRLSHPRILRLITSTPCPDYTVFITPFMKYGNIRQYLSVTPAADRLNLMIDVAEGLKYLHNEALVVHGDLRPGKVLVSESGRALITGFALSTDILACLRGGPELSESAGMEQPAKPSTYYCPELLGPAPRRTTASDIYAFGTMIFEILAGQEPVLGFNTLQTMGSCPLSGGNTEALWQLSRCCRVWDAHKRPHAAAILRELSDIERGTSSPDHIAQESETGIISYAPGLPLRPQTPGPNELHHPIDYLNFPVFLEPPRSVAYPPVPRPVFPEAPLSDPPTFPIPDVPNLPLLPTTSTTTSSQVGSPSVRTASTSRISAAVSPRAGINYHSTVADNSGLEHPTPERISSSNYPANLTFLYDTVPLIPRGVELCYQGPCSSVWRASVRITGKEQNVAIKILHAERSSPGASGPRLAFDRELLIWQRLGHPKILPLFTSNPEARAFVSPFMQEGTLLDYIDKHEGSADPLRLICDVAEGIYYLHKTVRVVHGDLKPANIFVTDDGHAIIGDFGLSTTISPANDVTELSIRSQFTVVYCAPELMADNAVYPSRPGTQRSKTTMTDIYAFGLVVYQVYGGILPKAGPSGHMNFFLQMNSGILPPKLEPNRRASLFCEDVWAHCVRCWSKDPLGRPEIDALLRELKGLCVIRSPPVANSPCMLRASPAQSAPELAAGSFPGGLPPMVLPLSDPVPASSGSAALDVSHVKNAAGTPGPSLARRLARAREVCTRCVHIAAYLSLIYFAGYWVMMWVGL